MARGDYVEVTFKTGGGFDKLKVSAETVGAKVEYDEPREKDSFVEIKVSNQAGEVTKKALFAKGEVIAIVEGHEAAVATKATAKGKS